MVLSSFAATDFDTVLCTTCTTNHMHKKLLLVVNELFTY